MEQELAAGLSEEQVTKFIGNDEVNARQVGGAAIPAVTGLCFRSVDEGGQAGVVTLRFNGANIRENFEPSADKCPVHLSKPTG